MRDVTARQERDSDFSSLFVALSAEDNSAVCIQVAAVEETVAAIRALEEITRQVDVPYIGIYLSS
jgi:hypothetical protein